MTNSAKAVVLLSGGLDSSVNLARAAEEFGNIATLTIDYGQRAAQKEIKASAKLSRIYQAAHHVLDLSFLGRWSGSSLTDKNKAVPIGEEVSIDDLKVSKKTASSVWVPNRNGLFLNVAAALAESLGANYVIPGFNKEEAATFPDNSQNFLEALNLAFKFSTQNQVEVKCFTTDFDKAEIVKMGVKLKFDFKNIWPCYFSEDQWCRVCESCQRSIRALTHEGVEF